VHLFWEERTRGRVLGKEAKDAPAKVGVRVVV